MSMPALQAPPQPKAPGPRPRRVPLTPMRHAAAKSMRKLAGHMAEAHPGTISHQHVRDAARMLESGNEEAAQRHLRAAVFSLTPQSMMRQGIHDDAAHIAAREALHGVHRHLLLVKDIADTAERNRAAIARQATDDDTSSPPLPRSPLHADPNAGYGPGALAQKPQARQPGGDRALNAPDRTNSGGSDPAVADPVGPQPKGSKQFARTWDQVAAVVELAATMTKEQAHYRPGGTPGHRCGDCTMIRGHSCTLVEGLIDPGHVCDHFEAAGGARFSYGWDDLTAVIDLNWAAWDAGHGSDASQKAHDTASATASATARRDIAARSAIRSYSAAASPTGSQGHTDRLHAIADEADQKFPSTRPGTDIRAAADSFSKGDAEGANQHLEDARTKLRAAAETKGQQSGRFGQAPAVQDSIALDNVLKTNKGQAQMMAQDQEDAARAAAKAAKKAAKTQNHAVTWDDLASVVELSAETGRLAVTPAPYGKPGGPGLYNIHGLKHSDYLENIVKALMRKGIDKGKATAIARGSIRKWMIKSKHPEVRAAAAGAEAEELKAQARAHAHAVTWDDVGAEIRLAAAAPSWDETVARIELAAAATVPGQMAAAGQPVSAAKSANATAQPRVGAGSPAGGQFAPAGSGGGGKKPDAHQKHVAHLQHLATHGTPAQQAAAKAALARLNAGSSKKTTSKAAAKPTTTKTAATKASAKATASKTASTKAKATAHQAHVAHLQHLATHGSPTQQQAAKAVLARLGVKP
jgi:hypothetical protein